VQKVLDFIKIKRMRMKMTDTTSCWQGGDKKGTLNHAPQAGLKAQEGALHIIVDATLYFSQTEVQ
jgi:hypothetical protein